MSNNTDIRRAQWLVPLSIFIFALAVRMAFVVQAKDSPYWRVPLVDAAEYDRLAWETVGTGWLAPLPNAEQPQTPYFQPPLYQLFLALVYRIMGHTWLGAILIQYLIGSFVCVLVYFLGLRYFGRGIGIAAGIATALTATQIFYDGRLLPPVLITLLNLTILLLAAAQMKSSARWRWPVIGLLLGLSVVTRPDILVFVPALLLWMWLERGKVLPSRPALWIAVVLVIALFPVGLTAVRNTVVGRDFALISTNGGVNFFVGNFPNMEKTLAIRPGIKWDVLIYAPVLAGAKTPSECDRYFYRLALSNMRRAKLAAIRNFGQKLIWVWRGPEIRRNEDEYYMRRVSSVYRALLWRKGNFGFPFGIIAPLGLLGMGLSLRRRREMFLPYAYVLTQALMLVAFFPCTRYRAPIVPVLLIFGSAAVFELVQLARHRQFQEVGSFLLVLVGLGLMTTLYPPTFEGTRAQQEAENYRLLGGAYYTEGNVEKAIIACERGTALNPDSPDLRKWLMGVYHSRGEHARAAQHGEELLRVAPEYGPAYQTMIEVYTALGKKEKAAKLQEKLDSFRRPPPDSPYRRD